MLAIESRAHASISELCGSGYMNINSHWNQISELLLNDFESPWAVKDSGISER